MPHPPVVAQRPGLKTFRQPVAGRATAIRYYAHSGRNKAGARKIIWLRPSRCRKIKLLPGSTNGLAIDNADNLYVADACQQVIWKITPNGNAAVLAGTGKSGYKDGPARAAELKDLSALTVSAKGDVYL